MDIENRDIEKTPGGCQGGRVWRKNGREVGVSRCLLHMQWISSKVLLHDTVQQPTMEKNTLKKNVYISIAESLCCTAVTKSTILL